MSEENKTATIDDSKKQPKADEASKKAANASATDAKKNEGAKEDKPKGDKSSLTGKLADILKQVEALTVMELSELVKGLEERFGVSAAAQVAVAAPGTAAGAAGGDADAEEKTSFTVVLTEVGAQKIQVIKELRAVTTLGLKEAKDLVEAAPKPVKDGVNKEEAEKIKAALEKAGAKIELK